MALIRADVAPSVEPTAAPPSDYQNIQATPADFGAQVGQATERLGGAVTQAGDTGVQVAIQRQDRHNQISQDEAFNQLQDGALALTSGPDGLFNQRGKDALDGVPKTQQALEDLRNQIRGGLQNDAQRLEFDQTSRRFLGFQKEGIGRFYDQQHQEWALATNQASEDIQGQSVAANYNNDQSFGNSLSEARTSAVRSLQIVHGQQTTGDMADQALGRADSKLITARAMAWGTADPSAAMSWLETGMMPNPTPGGAPVPVRSRLDPQTMLMLQSHFRAKDDLAVGTSVAQAAMGSPAAGPVPEMIVKQASATGVPPVRALTWAKIESNVGAAADAPGNSHTGVYQMGPDEFAANGGQPGERGDTAAQVRVGVASIPKSMAVATSALGRPAQDWEGYMVHQQGAAGGPALLTAAPTTNVVDALAPAYGGSRTQAVLAVTSNGGSPTMTSGQFLGMWRAKYQDAQASVGGVAPPTTAQPAPSPASEADVVQRIINDPALADRPAAIEHALNTVQRQFALQRQTRQDTATQAGNEYITKFLKDPFQVSDEDIANDNRLTGEQKWSLSQMRQQASTHGDKQATEYGPGIYKYLQMVTPQPSGSGINELGQPIDGAMQPAALSDPTTLWSKVPSGVLTIAGVQKLTEIMQGGKTLDGQNDNRMMASFLDGAKQRISRNNALGGNLRDPQGETLFTDFLTQALPAFQAGRNRGVSAADLLNSKSADYIGKSMDHYIRPMSVWIKDLHDANGEDAGAAAGADTSGIDLKTQAGVMAAYASKKLGYNDAEKALEALGIPHATGPAEPAPVKSVAPQVPVSQ
jgi:hypothetical protein